LVIVRIRPSFGPDTASVVARVVSNGLRAPVAPRRRTRSPDAGRRKTVATRSTRPKAPSVAS